MSIIYKALQKTQRKREHESMPVVQQPMLSHKSHWLDITLLVIILVLLCVVLFAYYPRLSQHASVAPPVVHALSPEAVKEAEFKSKYVLNGVFVSDQNIIAMINNQYFHLGDTVGDMKIISISDKSVRLKNAAQIIELQVPI